MNHSLFVSQLQILTKSLYPRTRGHEYSSTRVHEYTSKGVQEYTYGNNDVNGTVLIIRLEILRVIGKMGYEKKFAIVII